MFCVGVTAFVEKFQVEQRELRASKIKLLLISYSSSPRTKLVKAGVERVAVSDKEGVVSTKESAV